MGLEEIVPERLRELDLKAVDIGFKLGRMKSDKIHQAKQER